MDKQETFGKPDFELIKPAINIILKGEYKAVL